jgi:hypothetical protein
MSDSEPDTPLDVSSTASEAPETPTEDADADYRDEAEWGLDDTKASEEPVERYAVIGGRERRLLVREATNADVDRIKTKLDNRRGGGELEALAEFFREHIEEPASFATTTAQDVEEMRMGVAEKLLDAIAPDTSGNPLR